MTYPDSRFLLHAVPAEISRSYLKRTFGWQPTTGGDNPETLFVRYYRNPPPESCNVIVKAFPDVSHLIQSEDGRTIFLISAGPLLLSRILTTLASATDPVLLPEIEELLEGGISSSFKIRDQIWTGRQPRVMGIVNITPDSFFDGGDHFELDDYTSIARQMIEAGADVIDIGGESSRPGAQAVGENEEMARVIKAIKQIRQRFSIPLSIDTVKPSVADSALAAGADMVNDISGLATSHDMLQVVRRHNASYCLMHIQGTPENMQKAPRYTDIISEIYHFFCSRLAICTEAGLEKDRILLDPGIGFGKTVLNNIDILRLLPAFSSLGCLILLGTSNKSFIGKVLQRDIDDRTAGTMATQALGWVQGASIFRVHDVRRAKDTLEIARYQTREVTGG